MPGAKLTYESIEEQVVECLECLRPAAEHYWEENGNPGEDPGPYVFFSDVVGCYIEILLAMDENDERNALLTSAFGLVEVMLGCGDRRVRDLAYIQLLEGAENDSSLWRAKPFLPGGVRLELDRWQRGWQETALTIPTYIDRDPPIIDLCGVREVILAELRGHGVGERDVPGISAPRKWHTLASLEAARADANGVVFLSSYGTTRPCLITPAREVTCSEPTLHRLATDLVEEGTPQVLFFTIRPGERVWQMNDAQLGEHLRWENRLWLASRVLSLGLESSVRRVLAGLQESIH